MDDEQQRVEKYIYRRNRDAKKIRKLFLSSRKKPWKKRQKKDERMVLRGFRKPGARLQPDREGTAGEPGR